MQKLDSRALVYNSVQIYDDSVVRYDLGRLMGNVQSKMVHKCCIVRFSVDCKLLALNDNTQYSYMPACK